MKQVFGNRVGGHLRVHSPFPPLGICVAPHRGTQKAHTSGICLLPLFAPCVTSHTCARGERPNNFPPCPDHLPACRPFTVTHKQHLSDAVTLWWWGGMFIVHVWFLSRLISRCTVVFHRFLFFIFLTSLTMMLSLGPQSQFPHKPTGFCCVMGQSAVIFRNLYVTPGVELTVFVTASQQKRKFFSPLKNEQTCFLSSLEPLLALN